MKRVRIGALVDAPQTPVYVDIDKLLSTRLFICAGSGGGKSYTLRRLLEVMASQLPFTLIDREGEFGSLREKIDAVWVADGGDLDPREIDPGILARKIIEERCSTIIDLSDMSPDDAGEWLKRFLQATIDAPKELRHPRLVLVDEAQEFCPEKGQGESPAWKQVVDLLNLGRKRGLVSSIATQRFSRVNKNAVAPCRNYLLGVATLEEDIDRTCGALGWPKTAEYRKKIKHVDEGQFFAQGPAFCTRDVLLVKIDQVETTHQSIQTGKASRKHLAPASSKAILKIADKLRAAKKEDVGPVTLEAAAKEIVRLKRELSDMQTRASSGEQVRSMMDDLIVEAKKEAADQTRTEIRKAFAPVLRSMQQSAAAIRKKQEEITSSISTLDSGLGAFATIMESNPSPAKASVETTKIPGQPPLQRVLPAARPQPIAPPRMMPDGPVAVGDEELMAASKRMIGVLAQHPVEGCSQKQLLLLCQYRPGGSVNRAMAQLRRLGLMQTTDSGNLALTQAGMATDPAMNAEPLPRGRQLAERWLQDSRLPAAGREILRVVLEAGEDGLTMDEMYQKTGYSPGGSVNRGLSALRRTKLLNKHVRGRLAPDPTLL